MAVNSINNDSAEKGEIRYNEEVTTVSPPAEVQNLGGAGVEAKMTWKTWLVIFVRVVVVQWQFSVI
jgi:hypothetical protein